MDSQSDVDDEQLVDVNLEAEDTCEHLVQLALDSEVARPTGNYPLGNRA
jgi:hypothetical protein